jgi:hypothetical protein
VMSQWCYHRRRACPKCPPVRSPAGRGSLSYPVVLQWCYSGVTVVLQWCYIGVTVVLQWCYSGVTVVLQWCYSDVTVVLQWCYSGVTVVLQWCYSDVTVVLQWCYSGVTVVLQWCYSGVTVVLRQRVTFLPCGVLALKEKYRILRRKASNMHLLFPRHRIVGRENQLTHLWMCVYVFRRCGYKKSVTSCEFNYSFTNLGRASCTSLHLDDWRCPHKYL